jgi:hypothetical protein
MGMGIVTIEKTFNGSKPWANTYAFSTGVQAGLTEADLIDIGASLPMTAANTESGNAAFQAGAAPLLHVLVAWERMLHFQPTIITKVTVSDGTKNSAPTDIGPLASQFASIATSLPALRATGAGGENVVEPGNVALRCQRVPSTFSSKPGTLWYRACLTESMVKLGGAKLITWESPEAALSANNSFAVYLTQTGMRRFFSTGAETIKLGIPKVVNWIVVPPVDQGDLVAVRPISDIQPVGPASRQTTKGRRRAV